MTKWLQNPSALPKRRALIYISDLRTCQGELMGFAWRSPRRCDHPGCMARLSPSNRFGKCVRHAEKCGRCGRKVKGEN